jgi:ribonuclease R
MGKKHKNRLKKLRRKNKHFDDVPAEKQFTGKISVTPSGFGFVTPEGDSKRDIFIPPKYINSAMNGDKVKGILLKEHKNLNSDKGPAGKVTEIIERKHSIVVGELIAGHKVRPLNKRLPEDIKISGNTQGAKRGEWVEVELSDHGEKSGECRGEILSSIGKAGTIEHDLLAIIREYDLPPVYTEEQNAESATIKPRKINREDLDGLFCVTIDPHDAKDFDDAISLAPGKKNGQLELGVHIADVAAWISPNDTWDKEARKRSFTAYLPGKTMPMLPRDLTAKISLTEGTKSLAHSIIFTIEEKSGKIVGFKRFHSNLTITKRLTFDQVQNLIDGKPPKDWDNEFQEKIQTLVKLTRKMRNRRKEQEQFLELASPEIRVLCDEKNQTVTGLERKEQREADQLVEDCMLAANSTVACEIIESKIAGIFRVHPEPTPEKLDEFRVFMEATFGIQPGDISNRNICNRFLSSLKDDQRKPVIIGAFLRSLPRAYYLEEPELHFGLGKMRYSHFTSPIRRYPDLLVHQQLWAMQNNEKLRSKKLMAEFAADSTEKETNNDNAYYAANDRLKLHYLQSQLGEDADSGLYEGLIAKITSTGLLVDIAELGVYGFVPTESLGGSFRYRKGKKELKAVKGHRDYKCGDFIYVQLDRIDFIRGSAIFSPVKY